MSEAYARTIQPEPASYGSVTVYGPDGVTVRRVIPAKALPRDRAGMPGAVDPEEERPSPMFRNYRGEAPRVERKAAYLPTVPMVRSRKPSRAVRKQKETL